MNATEAHDTEDPHWVAVTDTELASDPDGWVALADRFEPVDHPAAHDTATWFRDGVRAGTLERETHALCAAGELRGFYSVTRASVKVSYRAWPLFELRKRLTRREPLPALLLSAIVRATDTDAGFGHSLFDHTIGLALQSPEVAAIVVEPDNAKLAELWRDAYLLRPMDDPERPGLLYYPLDPAPEATWP